MVLEQRLYRREWLHKTAFAKRTFPREIHQSRTNLHITVRWSWLPRRAWHTRWHNNNSTDWSTHRHADLFCFNAQVEWGKSKTKDVCLVKKVQDWHVLLTSRCAWAPRGSPHMVNKLEGLVCYKRAFRLSNHKMTHHCKRIFRRSVPVAMNGPCRYSKCGTSAAFSGTSCCQSIKWQKTSLMRS